MKIFITGGAGFIGFHLADFYLKQNHKVIIFDNFLRKGTKENAASLKARYDKNLNIIKGDIRNFFKLKKEIGGSDVIFHLAAQVAVTTSITNPREDFEINAQGSFNVLEASRKKAPKAILIYSSTNKVYGGMEDIKIRKLKNRYQYVELRNGIPEERYLDFHSPYGCSKGAADQYFRDYFRIYKLKTVIFRQSCIYGTHQFGIEDQGWVAWFTIAAALDKKITIYGDGKQVRDVLFVDDLVRAFDQAIKNIKNVQGQIYNIGGGPQHTLSLLELIDFLEKKLKRKIKYRFEDWRPGDQPVYISNIAKAKRDLKWQPKTNYKNGVTKLFKWVLANKNIINQVLG
jgi:CDP-paratose 2-epimerase